MKARFRGVADHPNKILADTCWWMDHLVDKVPGTIDPMPCTYLKCTSMIMDTINFSINYSVPFIPNLLRPSRELLKPATAKITSPSQQLFSNSNYQVSQSSFGFYKTSSQTLNKRSNVKMTLQYLGTGFVVTSEMINPKDEVSMFQQICGGESVCVFKGYLSPGENFQMVSRRHHGYPFSASIYINGLIAARISSCCEYRYRVGFQQGKRGCFRITELSGGKPCYRCGELYRKKTERNHSQSSPSEESVVNQEKVSEKTNQTKQAAEDTQPTAFRALSPITQSKQPRLKRRVKKKRRPPQNESESEQENKLCSKYPKHKRPPQKDSSKGQKPTPSVQSDSSTRENDRTSKQCKYPVTQAISVDTPVSSADQKEKLELPLPVTCQGEDAQSQNRSKKPEFSNFVSRKARCTRTDHQNGGSIEIEDDSIQAIHHRLIRALSEEICYSEVELSDSSDSTDIQSIAEEIQKSKIISNEGMTQVKLDQQVDVEKTGEEDCGLDARPGLVMPISRMPTLQQQDDQVAVDRNLGASGTLILSKQHSTLQEVEKQMAVEREMAEEWGKGTGLRPVMSSNQESTLQGPDQQVTAERKSEKQWGENPSLRQAISSNDESTIPTAATGDKGEVNDKEIHETGEKADEEGLHSQITDLIAVLQECDEVDQLVLRNTGMTDLLLQHLTPAILVSKSEVETINLNLNEIGPKGAESLVQLLREKPCIHSLLLYGNQLGDKGIKTLFHGLSDILITQRKMYTTLSYDMPLAQLSELDVGGNHMSDEALRSIVEYLRLNPFLKHLGLAQISVQAVDTWQELFDALKINTNLTHLLLDENGLGDNGAKLVAEVMQVNKSLVTIDLDGNDIGEEGGISIKKSLSSTRDTVLTTISLDNNHISEETMTAIQTLLMLKQTDQ